MRTSGRSVMTTCTFGRRTWSRSGPIWSLVASARNSLLSTTRGRVEPTISPRSVSQRLVAGWSESLNMPGRPSAAIAAAAEWRERPG